jgi:hypothetical protein
VKEQLQTLQIKTTSTPSNCKTQKGSMDPVLPLRNLAGVNFKEEEEDKTKRIKRVSFEQHLVPNAFMPKLSAADG